ncbi:replication-associated recombination protein A [Chitinophagales bacterium]|nr:replication-associated recombination protein A [Chitinophagales bacterium]
MSNAGIPLAERLRPTTLDQLKGQHKLVGKGKVINRIIESGFCPSIIFWGPPGVGKTTLARILANELKRGFFQLSAINSGVKDIRQVIASARLSDRPIVFIDEIHRFSKSQQDSLLGAVESGLITLIGATTENPSFEVIPALLSRCQVYVLEELSKTDLLAVFEECKTDELMQKFDIELKEPEALLRLSGGDVRKLLNLVELVVLNSDTQKVVITNELVTGVAQHSSSRYDKSGEQHYDIISAFIKSMRGSDPNAAVYWLARMIEGGEDPKFIARRMLILASEDIGNANPTALVLANTCFDAVSKIGFPESRIILSQTVVYLASSAKSNASYVAINDAQALVRQTGDLAVPLHLRNAPSRLMKDLGYGKDYQYSHQHEGNFSMQQFLPTEIKGTSLYKPGNNPREEKIRAYLSSLWKDEYQF